MKIKISRNIKWAIVITLALFALWWAVDATLAQGPLPRAPKSAWPIDTFTYQGRLNDGGGPANGLYDLRFTIYDAFTAGNVKGAVITYDDWPVTDGVFTVYLQPAIPMSNVFNGDERWLLVEVRPGASVGAYTALPRQPITPVPYAWGLEPGAVISGTATVADGWVLKASLNGTSYPTASAIQGTSATGYAVNGISTSGWGFYGRTDDGIAVGGYDLGSTQARGYGGYFYSSNGIGVYGESNATRYYQNMWAPGVYGKSANGAGVYGLSTSSDSWIPGGFFENDSGIGVYGRSTDGTGAQGWSPNGTGVWGGSNGLYGQGGHFANVNITTQISQTGVWAGTYWGNIIEGHEVDAFGTSTNRRFRVSWDGTVYADGAYNCGLGASCFNTGTGADVAERIDTRVTLQPGDVVEIDPDNSGQFRLAKTSFSPLVAGVISTNPAVTMNNNDLHENDTGVRTDQRPLLALVGQVPIKVSAENGAILPGDLLVASSTPGHAMKAGPNPPVGTIIGKALERLDASTGLIKMLVMLR